jgi:hemoglobin
MSLEISPAMYGAERQPVTKPAAEFLLVMGEERLRKMVADHYELIKKSAIYNIFPQDDEQFELAKKHAADFMIQICGGPKYFNMSRGAPQMVGRHQPFRITAEARIVWLELYKEVIDELPIEEHLRRSFWNYLETFSKWMINTPSN